MIFLARLQVLKWHRATYHTHTQYVLKQDLHYPYYPLVLLHKELESQSWSRLHRWVAPKKIFRVPLPKTQRLFAKNLELTFFTLFTFQCLGLKLGPSFETRGSAAMARIPAYTDDFFEGAAERVETKACWLDKDIWRLKVVWRCITCTKNVGIVGCEWLWHSYAPWCGQVSLDCWEFSTTSTRNMTAALITNPIRPRFPQSYFGCLHTICIPWKSKTIKIIVHNFGWLNSLLRK